MISEAYNTDCLQYMRTLPDNHFDLAIADPPYGIKANKRTLGNGHRKIYRGASDWDNEIPPQILFDEIIRVSKNQIIWGANHFISRLSFNSAGWIVWDKGTGDNSFADCELAFSSFDRPIKKFFKSWVGRNAKERHEADRIHPTQKPVALYAWLLRNYAKDGDTIFDPMMGSQSSRIAAYKLGFDFTGCELDAEYYRQGCERFERECHGTTVTSQGVKVTQTTIFV